MALITAIKRQKNKNRINVYLDNKFGFGIDLDNFVLLHLKINQELTDEEIKEIVKKSEFQKTLDKLLRFTTLRPRSEKEVKDYLKIKEVHESMHEDLFKKLKKLDLLNDEKFAKWWVDQRLTFKQISKRVLMLELRNKGIDKNIIDDVIENTEVDEEKMAKKLIEKKMYRWKNLDERTRNQKMSQYLAGKGFDWNIIEKLV